MMKSAYTCPGEPVNNLADDDPFSESYARAVREAVVRHIHAFDEQKS
jgi:hypothetical protein